MTTVEAKPTNKYFGTRIYKKNRHNIPVGDKDACNLESAQCQHVNSRGVQCKNRVVVGGPYCHFHRNGPGVKDGVKVETHQTSESSKLSPSDWTLNHNFKRQLVITVTKKYKETHPNWKTDVLIKKGSIVAVSYGDAINREDAQAKGGLTNPLIVKNDAANKRQFPFLDHGCGSGLIMFIPEGEDNNVKIHGAKIIATKDLVNGSVLKRPKLTEEERKKFDYARYKFFESSSKSLNKADIMDYQGLEASGGKRVAQKRTVPTKSAQRPVSKPSSSSSQPKKDPKKKKKSARERRLEATVSAYEADQAAEKEDNKKKYAAYRKRQRERMGLGNFPDRRPATNTAPTGTGGLSGPAVRATDTPKKKRRRIGDPDEGGSNYYGPAGKKTTKTSNPYGGKVPRRLATTPQVTRNVQRWARPSHGGGSVGGGRFVNPNWGSSNLGQRPPNMSNLARNTQGLYRRN